jgi:NAD-dependent SIR2 family protein deacetylase
VRWPETFTSAGTPEWAYGVRRLVVLSGAGISTDSGIPDFRGPSGAWTLNPGAQQKHTYRAFLADPQLRGSYWKSRYEHPIWRAKPNAGHLAVAALANSDIDTTVVTQNTDGLHQQAGTPADRVIELHGTMHEVSCVECGHRSPTADAIARIGAGEAVPPCLRCGGILKTASTMFGQTMSPAVFARAEQAVTTCGLLLAVGTTLTVEPAGSLCASAVGAGAALVIVNRNRTPYDGIATEIIRDPLSEALPGIARHLLALATRSHAQLSSGHVGAPGGSLCVPRPSQLLRAEARIARFRSRADELEQLTAWCADVGVRAHLISGPAGVGKTRLALELADGHELELPAEAVQGAVATALLCGAASENAALTVLGHIPALQDADIRIRTARWLRDLYPPAASRPSPYWDGSLPDPLTEELIAAVVTPRFLMGMLMETTQEQDRRALSVLARAAATRPGLRVCLTELLSVLPGLSPVAVDVALTGGYPAPLAEALTCLAQNAALPAELLEAIPAGNTVLGEFPVLLAESLVEVYERRAETHPESGPRGLARMLIELAERLADLGRADQALAVAKRSVEAAGRLVGQLDYPARAAESLRRAAELARRER